mmetsp:Transcript_10071/g.35152  ORF Transcript_10071/g.35152 Transcript_10071/m.35152 type:complete len:322 (+) Transcript_10071:985-1950(+)
MPTSVILSRELLRHSRREGLARPRRHILRQRAEAKPGRGLREDGLGLLPQVRPCRRKRRSQILHQPGILGHHGQRNACRRGRASGRLLAVVVPLGLVRPLLGAGGLRARAAPALARTPGRALDEGVPHKDLLPERDTLVIVAFVVVVVVIDVHLKAQPGSIGHLAVLNPEPHHLRAGPQFRDPEVELPPRTLQRALAQAGRTTYELQGVACGVEEPGHDVGDVDEAAGQAGEADAFHVLHLKALVKLLDDLADGHLVQMREVAEALDVVDESITGPGRLEDLHLAAQVRPQGYDLIVDGSLLSCHEAVHLGQLQLQNAAKQ